MTSMRYSKDHTIYTTVEVYTDDGDDAEPMELEVKVEFSWAPAEPDIGVHSGPEDVRFYVKGETDDGFAWVMLPTFDVLFNKDFENNLHQEMADQASADAEDHRY